MSESSTTRVLLPFIAHHSSSSCPQSSSLAMSASKLQEIAKIRRRDVEAAKAKASAASSFDLGKYASLNLHARLAGPPPSFSPDLAPPRMHVAAEFKRASPSKGEIADLNFDEQIRNYANAKSTVISILTEPQWFKGKVEELERARHILTHELKLSEEQRPLILRKDFVVDEYQIREAKAFGADTLLLIVAILTDEELQRFISASRELGMEPLVEAANEDETRRALRAGAKVIGINNRNLNNFVLDLKTTNRCAEVVLAAEQEGGAAAGVIVLALSGMKTRADVAEYERFACVRGVLVGEHLMKSENPVTELRALVEDVLSPASLPNVIATTTETSTTSLPSCLVKICGVVRPEDALTACRSKADFVGMIFAPNGPRQVSIEEACAIADAVRKYGERTSRVEIQLPPATSMMTSPERKVKVPKIAPPNQGDFPTKEQKEWFGACEKALLTAVASARGPLLVGVFMDQKVEFVNEVVERVGLDLVQFHGKESAEECDRCIVPVIKVVHVATGGNGGSHGAEAVSDIMQSVTIPRPGTTKTVALLLDTTVKSAAITAGGTGVTFDWGVARAMRTAEIPILVAGGLKPDNVAKAAEETLAFGVDTSSGVQLSSDAPRVKDPEAIKQFVANAKRRR